MSIIRELLVKIRGDSSSLEQAAERSKTSLGKVGVAAEALRVRMAVGLVAVAATVVTSITAMVRSALAFGDQMDKLSNQLGVSTRFVGELQYAASQSGVEFGALTNSINIMKRNLAEAAIEGGPLVDTLNRIGLSSAQLAELSPEEQFKLISETLRQMGEGALQTNAAYAIFGRGAAAILPQINAGLQTSADEAERLGIALNEVEVKTLDDTGDSVGRLGSAFQGLANTIGLELAPYIDVAAKVMTEFVVNATSGVRSLHDGFLALGAGITNIIFGSLSGASRMLNDFIKGAKAALNSLPYVDLDASKGIQALDSLEKYSTKTANQAGKDFTGLNDGTARKAADAAREAESKRIKANKDAAAKEASKQMAVIAAQEAKAKAAKEAKKSEAKAPKADDKIIWNDDFERQWDEMTKRARETALDAMGPAQRGVERYIDILKEARQNNEDWANVATNGVKGFEDALVTAATTGKLSFKDMFNSIAADIARVLIRRSVTEPLANAASNFLGNINWGNVIAGARAIGGPVMGGQPYLVGEKGPELFVPSSSGGIVPSDKMGGGGQQIIVQQSLSFGLGVQQGVRQELNSMMPQILAQTQQGVQVAIERGGVLSRSVGRR